MPASEPSDDFDEIAPWLCPQPASDQYELDGEVGPEPRGGDNSNCSRVGQPPFQADAEPGIGLPEFRHSAEPEPEGGVGWAWGQDRAPLDPRFVAESELAMVEATHYQQVLGGRFQLELGFALVHYNFAGFKPGKTRQDRSGVWYESMAPSDWSRYYGWLRLNGRLWKWKAAPPSIWLNQLVEPSPTSGKQRRSRVYRDVLRYEDLIWKAFEEQASLPYLPADQSPIWFGMLQVGRPGDPDFLAGPRYWESDRTVVVVRHGDQGRPAELQVVCLHESDEADPGMSISVPLTEEQTRRGAWEQKRGRDEMLDDRQFKWTYMPAGVVFTAEERAAMCPGRYAGEVGRGGSRTQRRPAI